MASAEQLIELFNEARAKPAGSERERFLDQACGGDSSLKQQVLSLLQAEGEHGDSDFLKRTSLIRSTALVTEKAGDLIGRYKLLQPLGEGGCGVVYMAEQEEPVRRRVALKVIKLGMDTRSVIARFEAERQALALMDHPNIAKVLDAGATETGRPFFVMELVRGIKITDYCDQNNLTTEQRLGLFAQVCHAVQHAHQKGIIHRDLKPSNILVTLHDGVAVPKVIDFGIAKATSDQRLTDKTLFTAFEQFIGTPAYMSPEQAEMSGLDIDTRSDIYSLGVLLYELLTGRTPLDAAELVRSGMEEMRRRIRDAEPLRPSTRLSTMQAGDLKAIAEHRMADAPGLIHLLRGDLDWIVMKCLEKDRARRYETANGVAADIQRHLNCEPIAARPPSRWYEFQKTVRRHKVGFAAAAAVMIALGLGVIASTIQAVRASRAEREQSRLRSVAESKERKSQEVAQFLKDMLKGVGPDVALGRDTKLLKGILDQTAARLSGNLTNEPEVEAELRQTLATVYRDLSDYSNSITMLEQALRIQTNLHGQKAPAVASVLNDLGQALHRAKRPAEAEACYRQALAIQRELWGEESLEVAGTLDNLGSVLRNQRKLREAEANLRDALSLRKRLLPRKHPDISDSLANLGLVLDTEGKLEEAEQCLQDAFELRKELLPLDHPRVADALAQLGAMQAKRGHYHQAETNLLSALASQKKVLGEHRDTALTLRQLGSLLADEQRLPEAEQSLREAIAIESKVFGGETPDVTKLIQVMVSEHKLDEVRNLLRDNLTENSPAAAKAWGQLAVSLWSSGKTAEAGPAYLQALEIQKRLYGPQNPEIVSALLNVSMQHVSQNKPAEAESAAREALAILRTAGIEDRRLYLALARVAQALVPQGKSSDAESFYREAIMLDKKLQFGSRDHWVQAYYVHWQFAKLLQTDKRDREATEHFAQAVSFGKKLDGTSLAEPAHELAKLLITSTDSTLRDPSNAVVYAEHAVAATNRKNPAFLKTLAAAQAETGDFTTAARVQREALALLPSESEKQDFRLSLP